MQTRLFEEQKTPLTRPGSPRELHIDIETYSDVSLADCGVYRYSSDASFDVLLVCFAYDDGPVQTVETGAGDMLPCWLVSDLQDPGVTKVAHNAVFERTCLSAYLGVQLQPEGWLCTMVKALSLGLPAALGQLAQVLGTEEQKDTAGKSLIRYFCLPCTPTRRNGMRLRNLPDHDPAKWQLFCRYCRQDVETERDILRRLRVWQPGQPEQALYCVDQRINDRGVLVDPVLCGIASRMAQAEHDDYVAEAVRITGLDNPMSVQQLSRWLQETEGLEIDGLGKDQVKAMLSSGTLGDQARAMLSLRQQSAKASVKKYDKILMSAGDDHRVRGTLQINGAGRTGRWCLTGDHEVLTPTGWKRLDEWDATEPICVWNKTREALSFAKAEANKFEYTGDMISVNMQRCDMLCTPDHIMPYWTTRGWESAEMRTLIKRTKRIKIPSPGHDIEVRREHICVQQGYSGSVYCPTTTTGFFLVRRNGKVWITGNCGRLLQTQNLPQNHIEDLDGARQAVLTGDRRWVQALYPPVLDTLSQLIRTAIVAPEGKVLAVADYSAIEARVVAWIAGEEWILDAFRRGEDIYCATATKMFGVPVVKHGANAELRPKGKVATLACGYSGGVNALLRFGADRMGMTDAQMQDTVSSWRRANPHIVALWHETEEAFRSCLQRRQRITFAGGRLYYRYDRGIVFLGLPSGREVAYAMPTINAVSGRLEYMGLNQVTRKWEKNDLYGGKAVENIVQSVARDILANALLGLDRAGIQTVMHIHDETVNETEPGRLQQVIDIMCDLPVWAEGLPLTADGYETRYYRKD